MPHRYKGARCNTRAGTLPSRVARYRGCGPTIGTSHIRFDGTHSWPLGVGCDERCMHSIDRIWARRALRMRCCAATRRVGDTPMMPIDTTCVHRGVLINAHNLDEWEAYVSFRHRACVSNRCRAMASSLRPIPLHVGTRTNTSRAYHACGVCKTYARRARRRATRRGWAIRHGSYASGNIRM